MSRELRRLVLRVLLAAEAAAMPVAGLVSANPAAVVIGCLYAAFAAMEWPR